MTTSNTTEVTETTSQGVVHILRRDDWTCQVCGYQIKANSDERMFATLVGTDPTNPEDVEARCRSCHELYIEENQPTERTAQDISRQTIQNQHLADNLPVETVSIFERDDWTCQECGHQPPEDSDERMFATLIGVDDTNPDHFETLCREHHSVALDAIEERRSVDGVTESNPETSTAQANPKSNSNSTSTNTRQPVDEGRQMKWSDRMIKQLFALVPAFCGWFFGWWFLIVGITIWNPLRMIGFSSWPMAVHPEVDSVPFREYVTDVLIASPIIIGIGTIIIVVTTQIVIWMEPPNGCVTRSTKWLLPKIKRRLRR